MVALSAIYTRIEAPPVVPHPYGLFSVAVPQSPADTAWQAGGLWESWACLDPNTTTDPCINGTTPGAKEFEGCPNVDEFKPITVYLGFKRTQGMSAEVARTQATTVLEDAEEFAIEKHLWPLMLAAAGATTPTGTPVQALAAVEANLGSTYHGTGVIHVGRGMATALGSHLIQRGNQLQTTIGTPVVAGGGYPNLAILGSGAVMVRRGPTVTHDAWGLSTNDHLVLAERTYLVGWDCTVTGREATI